MFVFSTLSRAPRLLGLSMPPAAAPNSQQDQPPASRSTFTHIPGNPGNKVEDRLSLPSDSPIVTSLPFINWEQQAGPPATASAPRSKVVGTFLLATHRPSLLDSSRLEEWPFISTEVDHDELSKWARELDISGAFNQAHALLGDWAEAALGYSRKAANPDNLRLVEDNFAESELWSSHHDPYELSFLNHTSISDLLRAGDAMPDESFQPIALSRAYFMFGSKDNHTERGSASSAVRIAAESVTDILKTAMHSTAPSPSALARRLASSLQDIHLPREFCMHACTPRDVLREFELGYSYHSGTSNEVANIEKNLFLNVGFAFPSFKPILDKFHSGRGAAAQFDILFSHLLPSNLSSATTLVRLQALESLLARASWRAAIAHLDNAQPNASGPDFISSLIKTQTEVGATSAGDAAGSTASASAAPSSLGPADASYGSIRQQSIADALRSDAALEALDEAAKQTGVERVETLMQSNCVLLTRAELLQEAWLHNKHSVLASCSLDRPYLCPYIASQLTEDKITGTVPDRLRPYVYPDTELATLRTEKWSALKILEQALEIRRLERGTRTAKVKPSETFVVESCLRLISEYGGRLFFGLNLGFSPTQGLAFSDGVDLQLKGLDIAHTLPAAECAEWKTFLDEQFRKNWLDAGGAHYHSKLRSGRPDADESQLSEFLPKENAYFQNVMARIKRVEPVAEMRVALPTLFSTDPVPLPGTSASHAPLKLPDDRKLKNDKVREKQKKPGEPSGPGSKSKFSYSINPKELFLAGTVFKTDEIAQHYKLARPDHLCWPVLLTKKTGEAALELCPDHANHGDLKAAVHTRPKSFDLDFIYKKFTRAPTPDENKKADWKPGKKRKA